MRSSDRRIKIAEDLDYLDSGGKVDPNTMMVDHFNRAIDWQSHVDAGTYTKKELQWAALIPPDFEDEQKFSHPSLRFNSVPMEIEAFVDLGDGKYRLRFVTIADDGFPTVFDEEVEPEGDPEVWVLQFLVKHQRYRADFNRKAKQRSKELNRDGEVSHIRSGIEDEQMIARLNAAFPSRRK